MSPLHRPQPPAPADQEDAPVASTKATVVRSDTEAGPGRLEPRRQPRDPSDADPPTTEPDILAAVRTTRQEILAGNPTPAAIMDLICRRAQFLTDGVGAVIEVPERNELVYRAASGTAARSLGLRVDTQKSMSGLCFRTGRPMRCDDTARDERVDKAACLWVGIRSMVLVPVLRDGRAVGVLAVIAPAVAAFGDRDVWTLQLLADVLAEALGAGLVGQS
jgi:GAF domain-containing protein